MSSDLDLGENPGKRADGSWGRTVRVGEKTYRVTLTRGARVRIAFKPRGENIGFRWYGAVYDAGARELWHGRVEKSTGVRSMLVWAGVIACSHLAARGRGCACERCRAVNPRYCRTCGGVEEGPIVSHFIGGGGLS
jgi:hypothetical protein